MSDSSGPGPSFDPALSDPYSTASGMLAAAVQRDPQAWKALVNRYSRLILAWCRKRRLSDDDAADVFQIVMLQVAQYLPDFKKDGETASFRRWLWTITRTKINDYIRIAGRQPQGQGGSSADERFKNLADGAASDDSIDADGSVTSREIEQYEAVLALGKSEVEESTWQAFWMTAIEDLSSPEVGAMLGMSANAVRLARMRVIRRLRELGREFGTDGSPPKA